MNAPLEGIRVIDFTHVLAGPACSYFLSCLGADVVKVESVERGDAMRHRGGTDAARAGEGMSTAYLTQGGGKRSIAIDLETPRGRAVMDRLLAKADVFVENHLPKTLTHLGLCETQTRVAYPRLIHCAMTGYGRGGPMENTPAYDVNIQAISGLMSLTGTAETGPLRTGAPIMDYSVAIAAAFAVTTALYTREKTGRGSFIDVSMLDTAFTLMSSAVADYRLTGHTPKPRGNAANSRSPGAGTFPCKQGMLSLGVNEEKQFERLAIAIGRADWLDDTRFCNRLARSENRAALEQALCETLVTKTAVQWEAILHEADVPCAALRTLPEALEMPHIAERLHRQADQMHMLPLPFRFSSEGLKTASASPRLGEHTAAILAELGYTPSEINDLLASRIVKQDGTE